MGNLLLAHLFPYIKGSYEDIATYSLHYLLSQSVELNKMFTNYTCKLLGLPLLENICFESQKIGASEEKERPDLSGFDENGNEVFLYEMKFYASLTSNQPNTYLKRLKGNQGKGLLFICPMSRITTLWSKLKEICEENFIEISERCIDVDGVRMGITTWSELLFMLKEVASSVDVSFVSDILQLEGYCQQIDSDAFIPFSIDDLSARKTKLEERYYLVVDEVMDCLLAEEFISTSSKGLKRSAYRYGYTASLYIDEYTITLNYDRNLWNNSNSEETPFWVAIRNNNWKQTDEIKKYISHIPSRMKERMWGITFLALNPLLNEPFTEVCEDMVKQIIRYIDELKVYSLDDFHV